MWLNILGNEKGVEGGGLQIRANMISVLRSEFLNLEAEKGGAIFLVESDFNPENIYTVRFRILKNLLN